MSTDIHTTLSQITRKPPLPSFPNSPLTTPTAATLLTLFQIALAYVHAGEDANPEGLRDRLSSFVRSFDAAHEDFPAWSTFTAAEQGIVERLVAPENRGVLLQEGRRCEGCYGRQG